MDRITLSDADFCQQIKRRYQGRKFPSRFPMMIFSRNMVMDMRKMEVNILYRLNFHYQDIVSMWIKKIYSHVRKLFLWQGAGKQLYQYLSQGGKKELSDAQQISYNFLVVNKPGHSRSYPAVSLQYYMSGSQIPIDDIAVSGVEQKTPGSMSDHYGFRPGQYHDLTVNKQVYFRTYPAVSLQYYMSDPYSYKPEQYQYHNLKVNKPDHSRSYPAVTLQYFMPVSQIFYNHDIAGIEKGMSGSMSDHYIYKKEQYQKEQNHYLIVNKQVYSRSYPAASLQYYNPGSQIFYDRDIPVPGKEKGIPGYPFLSFILRRNSFLSKLIPETNWDVKESWKIPQFIAGNKFEFNSFINKYEMPIFIKNIKTGQEKYPQNSSADKLKYISPPGIMEYDTRSSGLIFNGRQQIDRQIKEIKKIILETKESIEGRQIKPYVSSSIRKDIDINQISEQVYQDIEKNIMIEKERRGL